MMEKSLAKQLMKNFADSPAPDMDVEEEGTNIEKRKSDRVSESIKIDGVVKHEQMLPVCSLNGDSDRPLCSYDSISTNKYWIIHLIPFNLSNTSMTMIEIIEQLPQTNITEMELESTVATSLKHNMEVKSTNLPTEKESWGVYMPPVEGRPISIWNNTMQVTSRSLPYVFVTIKHKLVPAVIDPSVSSSFICNDLYNIYVQSNYCEEEICYSENRGKMKTAYCWWSQRRALVRRALIALPITWNTTRGGVQDVIKLNLIEPNPGFINGYIVLGRDFYTKYIPSFCLTRNLMSANVGRKQNQSIRMQTYWFTVTDYIPIVDEHRGVVYFIDKYKKNRKYSRKTCCKRNMDQQIGREKCNTIFVADAFSPAPSICYFYSNYGLGSDEQCQCGL